ncbi:MAG TPA: hypothetical protein PKI77_17875, partial [Mycobacterium sp.]|nr:hypothetical protein [Mycobacterium sp.]
MAETSAKRHLRLGFRPLPARSTAARGSQQFHIRHLAGALLLAGIMASMSENPEYTTETTPVPTATPPVVQTPAAVTERPANRLHTVAAWVGIVAGTVFVVAVIFFSGF